MLEPPNDWTTDRPTEHISTETAHWTMEHGQRDERDEHLILIRERQTKWLLAWTSKQATYLTSTQEYWTCQMEQINFDAPTILARDCKHWLTNTAPVCTSHTQIERQKRQKSLQPIRGCLVYVCECECVDGLEWMMPMNNGLRTAQHHKHWKCESDEQTGSKQASEWATKLISDNNICYQSMRSPCGVRNGV